MKDEKYSGAARDNLFEYYGVVSIINANGQPAPNIVIAIQKAIAAHRQR